jgi:hypothetical protein
MNIIRQRFGDLMGCHKKIIERAGRMPSKTISILWRNRKSDVDNKRESTKIHRSLKILPPLEVKITKVEVNGSSK